MPSLLPARRLAHIGCVLLFLCLGLLGGTGCREARRRPGEVRIHLEAEPAHLNPFLAGDALGIAVVLGDVVEPLYELDAASVLVPALATSWVRSADDTEWIFALRREVRWHDGARFSARDVVFTFGLLRSGAPSVLAADFDDLVAIDVPDPHTVRLRFSSFRLGRDQTLALVPILPEHVFAGTPPAELANHPASRAPIGTGPYRFEAWDPGREIRLQRFDDWWGPRPALVRASYRIIPDRVQAAAQMEAGALDLMARAPSGPGTEKLLAGGRIASLPYEAPYFLGARWACRGPLADPRVRRAMTMLLDRETILKEVLRGRGRLASGPWEPDDPAYDPGIMPWPYDPTGARALLDEAGRDGTQVTLLVPAGSVVLERIATIWREDARKARVDLTIRLDSAVLDRARRGEFEGLLFGWTTGREQDFYHHFHSSQIGGENYGGVSDRETDELLEAIRRTPAAGSRAALEHALHRRLHELEPLTVISVDVRTALHALWLRGVSPTAWGVPVRRLGISGS